MEKQENSSIQNTGTKKKRKWLILLLLLLLLLGLGAGYFYQILRAEKPSRLERDSLALAGMLEGKTPEEIEALLNAKVEEGMVNVQVAAEPVFEYNGKKGRIGIENIAANHYAFQVDLVLENGDLLYRTGLIDPGSYIEFIELDKKLQPGDYNATAVFKTYSLEEAEEEIAEARVNIILHVTDGQFYK